jgi:DNA invertase Pin-like site-specific DNA recombinase
MLIGYARVSTQDQTLNLQKDALEKIGCTKIFTDIISGAKSERPGLLEALAYARAGDTFVVWKLDRLGRSLPHLIDTLNGLKQRGIDFMSLTEKIDTTTPGGKLMFHVMGAMAEFYRDILRERTKAGLESARARGRFGGRPELKGTNSKVAMAKKLYADKTNNINDICKILNISRATLYRYIKVK